MLDSGKNIGFSKRRRSSMAIVASVLLVAAVIGVVAGQPVLIVSFDYGPDKNTVVGERFLACDITFENTAGAAKHQAVALRVGSDLSAFYRCSMLAYQDTLYVHSNRQFFVQCLIIGTVDFIFGDGEVVLQNCDIQVRRPGPGQKNMITAQGRTDPNQNLNKLICMDQNP
ncbi:Pectinesterase/pectinesterase inhibitor 3 [Datura stramonium]|uniref:Pectinesterase n=1 Tax=Datura stramonium TaxID=4076 RepID=A0ABS8Y536_DATST|nr:Pectinesterase/pectinesterase inhibitor 3 [Datura stramonium]